MQSEVLQPDATGNEEKLTQSVFPNEDAANDVDQTPSTLVPEWEENEQ